MDATTGAKPAHVSVLKTACVNLLGGFLFGYTCIGIHASTGLLWRCIYGMADDTHDNQWYISMLQAVVSVGGALGALVAGWISEHLGRKKTIFVAAFLSAVVFASAVTPWFGLQVALRVITGFGVGLASSACTTYVGEMAPKHQRGMLGCLFQVSLSFGILLAIVIGYFVLGPDREEPAVTYCQKHDHEALLQAIIVKAAGGIVAIALAVLSLKIPESESWKIQRAKHAHDQLILNCELAEHHDPTAVAAKKQRIGMFTHPRPIVTGLIMAVALQMSGIQAVNTYTAEFFVTAGVQQKHLGSIAVVGWNFVTSIIAPLTSDKLGRRKILIPSMYLLSVAILLLDPVSSIQNATVRSSLFFGLLAVYTLGFQAGPGCLFWVICNEIFPESIAHTAFSVINALQWSLATLITISFMPLTKILSEHAFLLFGIPGLVLSTVLLLILPETRHKSAAQVTEEMTHGTWLVLKCGSSHERTSSVGSVGVSQQTIAQPSQSALSVEHV